MVTRTPPVASGNARTMTLLASVCAANFAARSRSGSQTKFAWDVRNLVADLAERGSDSCSLRDDLLPARFQFVLGAEGGQRRGLRQGTDGERDGHLGQRGDDRRVTHRVSDA